MNALSAAGLRLVLLFNVKTLRMEREGELL